MGCYHYRSNKVNRLGRFFFTQKIGEYAYGFSAKEEEELNGDSLTVYGSTIVADSADFLRAFPQYRLEDYLYKLSIAQIQFMSVDNTHTKYLKGKDKKAWENYKQALETQKKFSNFLDSFKIPDLKDGEEYEIPVRKKENKVSHPKSEQSNNKI